MSVSSKLSVLDRTAMIIGAETLSNGYTKSKNSVPNLPTILPEQVIGHVVSRPIEIDCGGTCSASLFVGSTVTLTSTTAFAPFTAPRRAIFKRLMRDSGHSSGRYSRMMAGLASQDPIVKDWGGHI